MQAGARARRLGTALLWEAVPTPLQLVLFPPPSPTSRVLRVAEAPPQACLLQEGPAWLWWTQAAPSAETAFCLVISSVQGRKSAPGGCDCEASGSSRHCSSFPFGFSREISPPCLKLHTLRQRAGGCRGKGRPSQKQPLESGIVSTQPSPCSWAPRVF